MAQDDKVRFLWLLAFGICLCISVSDAFKVAVLEHDVIFSAATFKYMTRWQAVQTMKPNLDIYKAKVKEAAQQGADMMVFPEDGIYGLIFSRSSIRPFLESIPNPKYSTWNPCQQSNKYLSTYVQDFLSCLARNNSIMIVANMGDLERGTDRQYNTDVVFDAEGNLIAKYHKYHLFNEGHFDKPFQELVMFDSPIGRFGVATCFDLLFQTPVVDLIQKHNITNLVLPMAWMRGFPYLTAVGIGDAFARAYGINLVTANLHIPKYKFGGSGIFGPDGASGYYYNTDVTSKGKMVVSEVKPVSSPRNVSKPSTQSAPFSTNFVEERERFAGTVNDAEYDLVEISGTSGQLKMCKGRLCCYLDFQRKETKELFVFGVADGQLTGGLRFNAQSCLLLKCASQNKTSCGTETQTSSTTFQKLRLAGDFVAELTPMPQIVFSKSGQYLGLDPTSWSCDFSKSLIEGYDLNEPVVAASIFARDFTLPPPIIG